MFLLQTEEFVDPNTHLSLLSKYLTIAPHLVPQEQRLSAPTLRHPDLSLANVFLVPNSTKISSIIDWQDAAVLPLFMQAGYPAFCEHDTSRPQSLAKPVLPENFDQMSSADKQIAMAKFRLEEANVYYTAATGLGNPAHLRALRLRHLGLRQYLISQAGFPWDADVINLKAALVGIWQQWEEISSEPCPISFSAEEQEKASSEASEWREAADILSEMKSSLGIDDEGGTEPENLEHAREMSQELRLSMLSRVESHERELCWQMWPFKNSDDHSPVPP